MSNNQDAQDSFPPLEEGFEVNGKDYGLAALRLVMFVLAVALASLCAFVLIPPGFDWFEVLGGVFEGWR